MARELKRYQLIERTIIKTYRKELWNPFIRGVKNFGLINDGDIILLRLENTAESMLLAKLLSQLKRVSETGFELIITGESECIENADILNIPLSDGGVGFNKTALCNTLSDICEDVLGGMLWKSEIKGVLPIEKGNVEIIRPMFCVSRDDVERWAKLNALTFDNNKRESRAAELLSELKKKNPDTESNILNSLSALCLDTMVGYTKNEIKHSFLEDY